MLSGKQLHDVFSSIAANVSKIHKVQKEMKEVSRQLEPQDRHVSTIQTVKPPLPIVKSKG